MMFGIIGFSKRVRNPHPTLVILGEAQMVGASFERQQGCDRRQPPGGRLDRSVDKKLQKSGRKRKNPADIVNPSKMTRTQEAARG